MAQVVLEDLTKRYAGGNLAVDKLNLDTGSRSDLRRYQPGETFVTEDLSGGFDDCGPYRRAFQA